VDAFRVSTLVNENTLTTKCTKVTKTKGILTTKSAKDTKVSDIFDSKLRDLRGLRGESVFSFLVAAPPRWGGVRRYKCRIYDKVPTA
jgi:hypothetical protein